MFGFTFDQVEIDTTNELASYQSGIPMYYPKGSLVKFPTDTKVYEVVGDNILQWITSEEFKILGYRFTDITDLPDSVHVYNSFTFLE